MLQLVIVGKSARRFRTSCPITNAAHCNRWQYLNMARGMTRLAVESICWTVSNLEDRVTQNANGAGADHRQDCNRNWGAL